MWSEFVEGFMRLGQWIPSALGFLSAYLLGFLLLIGLPIGAMFLVLSGLPKVVSKFKNKQRE